MEGLPLYHQQEMFPFSRSLNPGEHRTAELGQAVEVISLTVFETQRQVENLRWGLRSSEPVDPLRRKC